MISKVSDYLYVTGKNIDEDHPHGDLDRIIVDGEIMPLREGMTENVDKDGNAIPRKNILRGEDIAFLMEAALERTDAVQENHTFEATFDRRLNFVSPLLVANQIRSILGVSLNRLWLKPGVSWENSYDTGFKVPSLLFPDSFVTEADLQSSPEDFIVADKLRRNAVERLFDDIAILNRYVVDSPEYSPNLYDLTREDWSISGQVESHIWEYVGSYASENLTAYFDRDELDGPITTTIQDDYEAQLRNRRINLSSDAFRFAKAGEESELWAEVVLTDEDSTRWPDRSISWTGFVKLGEIPAEASESDTMYFPSQFVAGLYSRLCAQAAQDKATGRWNTPFVKRRPNEYSSRFDEIFGKDVYGGNMWHRIKMFAIHFYVICKLRDRTRWQSN